MLKRPRTLLHGYLLPTPRRQRLEEINEPQHMSPGIETPPAALITTEIRKTIRKTSESLDVTEEMYGAAMKREYDRYYVMCDVPLKKYRTSYEDLRNADRLNRNSNENRYEEENNNNHIIIINNNGEDDDDDVTNATSMEEPFIPSADRLNSAVPPSCRAVHAEPNWLERAVMRSRYSNRHAGSVHTYNNNNNNNKIFNEMLPDPAILCLGDVTEEERQRAVAVAGIAAAFYATPRERGTGRRRTTTTGISLYI
ncbi:hypothetical protein LSM04_004974 [Trypanosoma melophagium]|uniref:uncharacterized protein n=1 Tax=Trypanosoma melophagium TaxID=715481 RepID=UPI00351AA2E3|nr:hypothetical protein LSM04_004974 [Trypanosoma melophagium]